MNKIYEPKPSSWSAILERPTKTVDDIELTVKEIFKEVQKKGDAAVAKYTSIFDGVTFENLEVSKQEIENAVADVPTKLKEALVNHIAKLGKGEAILNPELQPMIKSL